MSRFNATYIIARNFEGELLIIDAPDDVRGMIDGLTCEDNFFYNTEIIPTNIGLYQVECDVYSDDGANFFGENSDPEWNVTCKRVTTLCKI